ncbi:MAG TPA: glycosyltransferase family 39 protein [Flavitalea sp.]|nr:glycosyltransferase family 39 protein [Flavitalea sp.]
MITTIGVIVFYAVLSFLIIVILRRQPNAITQTEILLTFAFKILLGCVYGYIFLKYYGGDDTWAIHQAAVKETELLRKDPYQFFWEFTPLTAISNARNWEEILPYYLADLEYCLLAKTFGIINLITRGNYYFNVVFFNFLVFWGHWLLYRLLARNNPSRRRLLFFAIFFFPSTVFWLSGIRADGILFLFFSLTIYNFDRLLHKNSISGWIGFLIGWAGILIMRFPVALLIVPALIAWWLVVRRKKSPLLAFISVYGIALLLFFVSGLIPLIDGPQALSRRQAEYFRLSGNTRFELDTLKHNTMSYLKILPQAISNTFIRPLPWEAKGVLQLLASVVILFFWVLIVFIFLKRKAVLTDSQWAVFLLLLFFGVSMYITIGYTVPFPGAIVRYKAIAELSLICALLLITGKKELNRRKI